MLCEVGYRVASLAHSSTIEYPRTGGMLTWRTICFLGLLAFLVALPLLWPGDAPFIKDEPTMFLHAAAANQQHQLASGGVVGTVGLPYGPLSIWFYQGLLHLTCVPERWVVARALLMVLLMTSGLLLLSWALRLWRWFIPVVMVSPYLWFYSRHLWDNSLLLPVSVLALGCYAVFLAGRSSWALVVSVGLALVLPCIHLMSLALAAAILGHMFLFSRAELWRSRWFIGGVVCCILGAQARYLASLVWAVADFAPHSAGAQNEWGGWLFPLLGGRLLSGGGLDYFFGPGWLPRSLAYRLAVAISLIAYPAVLLGIVFAARQVWQKRGEFLPPKAGAQRSASPDARLHVSAICLVALALQIPVCGLSSTFFHPHYHNGLWIASVMFAWLAVDAAVKKWWGMVLVAADATALVVVLLTSILLVHQRGGTRGIRYGPTIADQHKIAIALGTESREDISCTVSNFLRFPSLRALRALAVPDNSGRLPGPLVIEFGSDDPRSGRVRVRSVAPWQQTNEGHGQETSGGTALAPTRLGAAASGTN